MTALDHLRKLTEAEAYYLIDGNSICAYCDNRIESHAPDCLWLAAKRYVESEDGMQRTLESVAKEIHDGLESGDVMLDGPCSPFVPGLKPEDVTIEEGPELSEEFKSPRDYVVYNHRTGKRSGFTLIELLVVIGIILLVSVLTIPSISGALSHRQVGEAARSLAAVLAGARDAAIRDNRSSGIRLMPDPLFNGQHGKFLADGVTPDPLAGQMDPTRALAYNRIVPIAPAPSYSEGFAIQVSSSTSMLGPLGPLAAIGALPYPVPSPAVPAPLVSGTTVLVLAEAVVTQVIGTNGAPAVILNPPTSWTWNVRLGDKVQINNAGPWYTVVGPMVVAPTNPLTIGQNPDLFVNVGMPGAPLPWSTTQFGQSVTPEFLLLVNGKDDNANGWIDEGWDGVDNDGFNGVDDIGEWGPTPATGPAEVETWLGSPPSGTQQVYTIARRPVPQQNAREIQLPSDVVIDASSWNTTQERTRVPAAAFNTFTGVIDIMINPDGSVLPTTLYSSPSSVGMAGAFYHLWLAERGDVYSPVTPLVTGGVFSLPMPIDATFQAGPTAAVDPTKAYTALLSENASLPVLKGEMRLVTLFGRTGQVLTEDGPQFNVANTSQPFLAIQQGAR